MVRRWWSWAPRAHTGLHHLLAELGGVGLGVADRPARVGHEDVVEGWPGHAHRSYRDWELGEQSGHEVLALFDGECEFVLRDGGVDVETLLQQTGSLGVVIGGDPDTVLP